MIFILSLVFGMILGVAVTPASASAQVLCSGNSYATCINAGYTAHGYETNSGNSYWTMYAGHNCTNYAAYMASRNGAGAPSHNLGNAMNWDNNAALSGFPVNGTPAVGSIAQWEAYAGPASWAGHVAYVEAVNSDGSITISEDNYNVGPFSWKRIAAGSSSWPSHFIHFADVGGGSATVTNRMGVLSGGVLNVKEGPVGATWTTVGNGSSFKLSPNRIAMYDGQLHIKEGSVGATWTTVTGAVDEFEVTDNRIGIRIGTQIFIKEGGVGAPWVHVADGVSFEMSPNRLAVFNGSLIVKEGNIYAGWVAVTGSVDDFQVTDNRIGIRVGSTISVKDGSIGAVWTTIGSGSSFKMSPNRIAMYDGQLHIKEGPVGATWVTVTGAVDAFEVTDNRVGILVSGQLSIKDGPLNATWTLVGGGSSFDLT